MDIVGRMIFGDIPYRRCADSKIEQGEVIHECEESQPDARPMHPHSIHDERDQAYADGDVDQPREDIPCGISKNFMRN
jgi:hypothetical protein